MSSELPETEQPTNLDGSPLEAASTAAGQPAHNPYAAAQSGNSLYSSGQFPSMPSASTSTYVPPQRPEPVNTSGAMGDVPPEVEEHKWHWGAFWLSTYWAKEHGIMGLATLQGAVITVWVLSGFLGAFGMPFAWVIRLLCLIAVPALSIYFGLIGYREGWRYRRFPGGVAEYLQEQRDWSRRGFIIAPLCLVAICGLIFFINWVIESNAVTPISSPTPAPISAPVSPPVSTPPQTSTPPPAAVAPPEPAEPSAKPSTPSKSSKPTKKHPAAAAPADNTPLAPDDMPSGDQQPQNNADDNANRYPQPGNNGQPPSSTGNGASPQGDQSAPQGSVNQSPDNGQQQGSPGSGDQQQAPGSGDGSAPPQTQPSTQ